MLRLRLLPAVALACALGACGGQGTSAPGTSPSTTSTPTTSPSPTPTSPTASPSATKSARHHARRAKVSKVLVVMEENHSLTQMSTGMPYTFGLAKRFGYATRYRAIRHPSLPNYISIAGGSTFGISDDAPPSAHPIHAPSVFSRALAAGHTAGLYADGMPRACAATNGGTRYAVKHNPWPYFVDDRGSCGRYDVPVSQLGPDAVAGTLPDVGMVIPNLCNDAHDCSLSVADAWFRGVMKDVFAGPDWASGRLAVVLTADEDEHDNQGNTVLTVLIHRSQKGHVVSTPLTHYSMSGLLSQVAGTAPLLNARTAPSFAKAFGLPLQK